MRRLHLAITSLLAACGGQGGRDDGDATSTGTATSTDDGVEGEPGEGADATSSTSVGADTGEPGTRASGLAWRFEHGTVGEAVPTTNAAIVDDGEDGLDATASAGLRFVDGLRPGTVAIEFAGDGASVGIDTADAVDTADLLDADALRIELAFRTDAHGKGGLDGAGSLLDHGGADASGWWLGIVDGRLRLRVEDGTGAHEGDSAIRVDDGVWHRAVVGIDRDDGVIAIAIDGTQETRIEIDPGLASVTSSAGVRAGAVADGTRAFVGEIDEITLARVAPARVVEGPRRATTTVFAADDIPAPQGGTYANVRIPAVVAMPSGTLVAFAEGRVHGECDVGDIDIIVSRSTDGGATWSAAETIVDPGLARVWNPVPVVDAASERLVLLTATTELDPGCSPSPAACACDTAGTRVEVRTSDDDGVSFGAPLDVTDDVTDPAGASLLLGPSHGIQLANGAHAGALVVPAMHRRSGDGKRGGHVLRSDDGGASWTIVATETDSDVNVNESSAAELADGRVLVNTRHQLSAEEVTPAQTAAGLRGEAIVLGDDSWSTRPPYTRVDTFRGPVVHGTLLAWPGSDRFGDARRLLFSLPAGEHGTNAGRRHDLRMWVSHDDGASWIDGVRLTGEWTAYSDVVAIDGDHVGVLFETGVGADGFLRRIEFLRAAVQPLDDATLGSWSFEDGVIDGGPFAIELAPTGEVATADGRLASSSAVRFSGDARLCASEASLRSALDVGLRDDLAIEAVFRTETHGDGGSAEAGTLAGKTRTSTEPAWWLRVEDGHVRFLASICDADALNCGVVTGECAEVTSCENVGLVSELSVADGAWHRVVVTRDAKAGTLRMRVDDEVQEASWPAGKVLKNDEPFCLGAFADGARAFDGDLDLVRLSSRPAR